MKKKIVGNAGEDGGAADCDERELEDSCGCGGGAKMKCKTSIGSVRFLGRAFSNVE